MAADSHMAAPLVPLWNKFEFPLESTNLYANPFQEVQLAAVLTSPSGKKTRVDGFWDGGRAWRIRFRLGEVGHWMQITTSGFWRGMAITEAKSAHTGSA